MADYILDTEYFPDRWFPLNYWPVMPAGPGPTTTAKSETPRAAIEVGIPETHSIDKMVPVIRDIQNL